MYRGVAYKCAMLHYNNEAWDRAIIEFLTIVNQTDPYINEMIAKCHLKQGNVFEWKEFLKLAADGYKLIGEPDKEKQVRDKIK